MQIGQVARRCGVSVQTVRLYERMGLIETAQRRESGYRDYAGTVIARILAIKQGQALGFSLREMGMFLQLSPQTTEQALIEQFVEQKVQQIEQTIQQFQRLRLALEEFAARSADDPRECPVIYALAEMACVQGVSDA
ncbi:heavy metal-responsive transcriptional regulator [Herpetosiphon giganteus]|uniref:heavy metal-responsive transcriptional regulator n=1 Tax=Herpetosiphon giganteus TaxID=2029754 RepID=UPI00195CCCDB|nr:heavy metal-responsive transcriptional regulator [Herpetosiphon giganteus]MBM7843703.1 DNA-binding transcriptional MerR regulator [Herpetosiphon giganteus]